MDAWLKVEQPSGTLTLLVTSYNLLSAVPSCSSEGLGFPGLQVQATPGPLSQIHSQNPSHVPVGDANIIVLFFPPFVDRKGCWANIPCLLSAWQPLYWSLKKHFPPVFLAWLVKAVISGLWNGCFMGIFL